MDRKFKVLDLFSGAGGMSEGFLQAGFHIPCATDYSKEAAETYINRHNQLGYDVNFYTGDIRDLSRKKSKLRKFLGENEIDVIVGGPPCQGFSLSGKRLADDVRNTLFLEYLKIVKFVKPKYFVIENVEGLLSYKFDKIKGIDGEIYENCSPQDVIKKESFKLGYFVDWKILNARDFGVPQSRPRVIFLGHKIRKYRGKICRNLVSPPNFPDVQPIGITVEDAISDLNFIKNGEVRKKYNNRYGNKSEYQKMLKTGLTPKIDGEPINSEILFNHETAKHYDNTIERFKLMKPGESIISVLQQLPEDMKEKYNTKKLRCTKLSKREVSPTVLTLPDDIIHYNIENPRILTVRELARLQSFDDSFEFKGKRTTGGERRKFETPQYTQVGNAVPPLFAKAIATEIYKSLEKNKNEE